MKDQESTPRRGAAVNVSPVAPGAERERGEAIVTKTKLRMVRNWGVSLSAAVMAALINPAVIGCSAESEESEWAFDDADMDEAISGGYSGQVNEEQVTIFISRPANLQSASPSVDSQFDLDVLRQRSLQCGSRSFVRPAGACISTTSMDFDADVTSSSSVLPSGKFKGRFTVWSSDLSFGRLSFSLGDSRSLNADFEDGEITRWTVSSVEGELEIPLQPVVPL